MKPRYYAVLTCLIASWMLVVATAPAQTLREKIRNRIEQHQADRDASGSGLQELQVQGRKVLVHLPAGYDVARPVLSH